MAKSQTEIVWSELVHANEDGLWWMEGPPMAFWAIVIGAASKANGLRFVSLLMLVGVAYGTYFFLAFAGFDQIARLVKFIFILLLSLWMLLVGIDLIREHRMVRV